MATGTLVIVNGKEVGVIKRWSAERQMYLVELASGSAQWIAEKNLAI